MTSKYYLNSISFAFDLIISEHIHHYAVHRAIKHVRLLSLNHFKLYQWDCVFYVKYLPDKYLSAYFEGNKNPLSFFQIYDKK